MAFNFFKHPSQLGGTKNGSGSWHSNFLNIHPDWVVLQMEVTMPSTPSLGELSFKNFVHGG